MSAIPGVYFTDYFVLILYIRCSFLALVGPPFMQVRFGLFTCSQARSQTMNTVGAVLPLRAHIHLYVYVCNTLLYLLSVHKRKKRLCENHKINTLIT
jgi:hypothetical protein